MMPGKLVTPGLLKIKVLSKDTFYDVIIVAYDVTNKILSRGSNYIVDLVV